MNAQLAANESSPVSLGDWILTLIVLAIPIVGLVMLFVWGFSSGTHPSKQNFCRASLILYAIMFALVFVFAVMGGFAALFASRSLGGAAL
ncbi:MAG TPA: hypothetical protein VKV22_03100 [Rhodanobacteraceae bacterium]|nr:hypothetical protein [Rhodanobacteraceae bacterium]